MREEIQNRKSTVMEAANMNHLCQQIENAQLTIEKDLAKLQSLWKTPAKQRPASQQWHLDVLEVYCEPDSQITEQCQRLGLRAERFTIHDGDLSTSAGREALWKTILEKKPKEIWMSPECKYWGNYSRRNMGRSISTANKILDGREKQRVHLKLCNEVFLHQMEVCGHFHLEQPQGSEAVEQPEMKDIREGTLSTVFDMCEVGKLLAPKIQRKTSGNNFCAKEPLSSLPPDFSTKRLTIACAWETTVMFQLLAKSSILADGYLFRNMQLDTLLVLVGMLPGMLLVVFAICLFCGKSCRLVMLMSLSLGLS